MRNITVEFSDATPLSKQGVELVERKGIGHPDSMCDGIAESVSRALCKEYLGRFEQILHHNTDQVELVGGRAKPQLGGGEITQPIYILLSGRATNEVGDETVDTGGIALKTAAEYLKAHFPNLDVENGVTLEQKLGMGSADLRHVFGRDGVPNSNDTSFGVSFAPFSLTEKLVYEAEKYVNGDMKVPASGEDVKVMGVRHGEKIILTIANGIVDKYVKDLGDYAGVIEEITGKVKDFVAGVTEHAVEVHVNTGDNIDAGSIFLTVTGSSAEQGDDGSVGRGNRANGLITPYRPMSMEATSGKNPVNHVGKVYNILSKKIADEIAAAGAEQVYVRLMSQIGKPIDQPLAADVQLIGDKSMEAEARRITDHWLENVTEVTQWCVDGKAETF